jgi:hypothetical protein
MPLQTLSLNSSPLFFYPLSPKSDERGTVDDERKEKMEGDRSAAMSAEVAKHLETHAIMLVVNS